MYNITLKVLGDRLKQIREYLNIPQKQLAEKINCKQNAISNLEKGKGGSITVMFNLLNYFSEYVFINLIFSEKFYLISNNATDEALKSNFTGVIIEIIQQAEKKHQAAVNKAINKSSFKHAIDKVVIKALNDVKKDVCSDINITVNDQLDAINEDLKRELEKAISLLK